jgi:hypothetical protein
MACVCTTGPIPGVGKDEVSYIPIKIGEPLSTGCERANTTGSIPQVLRYANFTLVGGALVGGRVSNAGINNIPSFFKTRDECYHNKNSLLPSSCN